MRIIHVEYYPRNDMIPGHIMKDDCSGIFRMHSIQNFAKYLINNLNLIT